MPLENLIQRADLNQRLTRSLEIKGQKSPILQLDNIVSAVVIADDLTQQRNFLEPTTRKLAAVANVAAVAAETAQLAIVNPVGSGVIGIVERVTAVTLTTQNFRFGLFDPAALPAVVNNLFFRDRRNVGVPVLRAFQDTDTIIRIVNEYLAFQTSNSVSTPWYETEGIVIQPGDAFGIQATTANVQALLTIWVEEIPVA